jgi:outer membrane receptor protein involved in Fe transport
MLWYNYQDHLPPFVTNREFNQIGFFVDDQWTLSPRITLNLGLRFDNMSNNYGTGLVFVQPTDPHVDITTLPVARERAATGDVFNFNNWSPRVGGAYQITEDGKTIANANFGRYYMPIGVENLRRLGPDAPLTDSLRQDFNIPFDQVDLNHNGYIDPDEVTAAARLLKDATPINEEWTYGLDNSWRAQVAPGTKNQFSDLLTANFERQLPAEVWFTTTFIYKRTGDLLVNWPINGATGESWEYERKPYTTSYGQQVELYSIVMKDYNGDGAINGDDVQFINDNNDYEVRNMPSLDGQDADRTYKGLQFAATKRFSNRFQMMASFLYSDSNGPANRSNFQNWNIEGPMIMDTGFFSSLNNSINNLEGQLPFTPKYEFKISGFYTIPKIETDFGARLRYNSGRPYWFLEEIPRVQPWDFPGGPNAVVDVGTPVIVGVNPNDPVILPASTILDLQFGKSFIISGSQSIDVSFDVFNLFDSNVITNADYQYSPGVATAITPGRKMRLGIGYQF